MSKATEIRVGQHFEGRGQFDGWKFRIASISPETEDKNLNAEIAISEQPPILLSGCQATIDYYRKLGWPSAQAQADELERFATKPRVEWREARWFAEWLARGLIAEVESKESV